MRLPTATCVTSLVASSALVALTLVSPATAAPAAPAGTPTCHGEPATIVVRAGDGERPVGTAGDDVVVIGRGAEAYSFDALDGNDTVCVLAARRQNYIDVLGGAGDDRLVALAPGAALEGGPGADVLVGSRYGDVLWCGTGNDRLLGGAGADVLRPGVGNDLVKGGTGVDRWETGVYHRNVVIDVPRGTTTGQGRDRITAIEGYDAGGGNDVFRGGPRADRFSGGGGDDRAYGRGGDDSLHGDDGRDFVVGGPGYDTCVAETRRTCETHQESAQRASSSST
ncbi:hypothetical protein BH11ACT8_BH11ACT8_25850 [soil metagenome]